MSTENNHRKLYCISEVEVWAGLCAGIAYWIGVPTWIVRMTVFFFIFSSFPVGLFIYIIFAIFIPDAPEVPDDYYEICE